MKKIKIQKKLELKKLTVASLQKEGLKEIKGGGTYYVESCRVCPD